MNTFSGKFALKVRNLSLLREIWFLIIEADLFAYNLSNYILSEPYLNFSGS
jgi:hypothetical protein